MLIMFMFMLIMFILMFSNINATKCISVIIVVF